MGSAFTFPCVNGHSVTLIGSPLEDKLIDRLNRKKFHKTLDCYLKN